VRDAGPQGRSRRGRRVRDWGVPASAIIALRYAAPVRRGELFGGRAAARRPVRAHRSRRHGAGRAGLATMRSPIFGTGAKLAKLSVVRLSGDRAAKPGGRGPRKNGGSTPCTSSHPRKNDIASCAALGCYMRPECAIFAILLACRTPGKMISRAVPPLGAICVPSARFSRSSSRAGLIFLEPVAPTCLAPLRPWSISTFDASSLC
jgi:hypothetical protein